MLLDTQLRRKYGTWRHSAATSCSVLAAGTSAQSDFDCKKKGGGSQECHAHDGENQYHAVMNNSTCAMVHPSSTAVPLLAMAAQVELTSKRGKRTVAMSDFYVPPEKSLINETVLAARRNYHRDLRSRARIGYALRLSEIWRKGEL